METWDKKEEAESLREKYPSKITNPTPDVAQTNAFPHCRVGFPHFTHDGFCSKGFWNLIHHSGKFSSISACVPCSHIGGIAS